MASRGITHLVSTSLAYLRSRIGQGTVLETVHMWVRIPPGVRSVGNRSYCIDLHIVVPRRERFGENKVMQAGQWSTIGRAPLL